MWWWAYIVLMVWFVVLVLLWFSVSFPIQWRWTEFCEYCWEPWKKKKSQAMWLPTTGPQSFWIIHRTRCHQFLEHFLEGMQFQLKLLKVGTFELLFSKAVGCSVALRWRQTLSKETTKTKSIFCFVLFFLLDLLLVKLTCALVLTLLIDSFSPVSTAWHSSAPLLHFWYLVLF